jgi:hypothetical protein
VTPDYTCLDANCNFVSDSWSIHFVGEPILVERLWLPDGLSVQYHLLTPNICFHCHQCTCPPKQSRTRHKLKSKIRKQNMVQTSSEKGKSRLQAHTGTLSLTKSKSAKACITIKHYAFSVPSDMVHFTQMSCV